MMEKIQNQLMKVLKILEYLVAVALIIAMVISLISFVIQQSSSFSIESFHLES